MVRPRVVPDPVVDRLIWIASALATELPDGPVLLMLVIKERDQAIERVSVGKLRICLRRSRSAKSVVS